MGTYECVCGGGGVVWLVCVWVCEAKVVNGVHMSVCVGGKGGVVWLRWVSRCVYMSHVKEMQFVSA